MLGSIRKFARDRKGAFAIQFALMAIPLTVCTGLAIDGGRAFLARFELASALDAAALAVGSTFDAGADLNAIATKFVNKNFRTEHDEPISLQLVPGDDTITLKGSVKINTYFMPLVGHPYVTVAAESQVRRGGSNIEVAMALDVTGSMAGSRLSGLKDAAKILIDEVVNVEQTPYFSKVAVVPWSSQVYTGTKHMSGSISTMTSELRGSLIGTTGISAATWRKSGTSTKTISEAGWRTAATAGGKSISDVDWRNGNSKSISQITKTNGNQRIRVKFSSNPSYSNGDTIYISGANGSYTGLNGNIYTVSDRTTSSPYYIWLKNVGTSTYTSPPSGSADASSGSTQECYDTSCNIGIKTSSSHTLSAGDYAHITGVNGFTSVNNGDTETWVVASVPSSTVYTIPMYGPSTSQNYSSGGRSSECYEATCRYRVTTTANHGFSTSDNIYIWNMNETSSGTAGNSSPNTTWKVENPSSDIFYLPGKGVDYQDWTSGGYAAACALATCNTQVTSAGHGLAVGDRVEIKSATGLTGINNTSSNVAWPIIAVSGDVLTLGDTNPSLSGMSGTYGSSGTSQCLNYGCQKMWFKTTGGSEKVYSASDCLVERYGADAENDADPSTSPLGINYTSNGSCTTTNYVTPLTSNTTRLNTAIDDLDDGGSTAGQIGIAWAWYMLSPNFASVWDKEEENKPESYEASELAKIAILMTDGEFNYATCKGVSSDSWGSGTSINCDPSKSPFQQAEAICAAMKKQDITIYTVGLQLDTSQYSDDFLLKCATSPAHAFLAADNEELKDAFSKIAVSISKLRIAK
jgi:Flp pilus assembly protein TadG